LSSIVAQVDLPRTHTQELTMRVSPTVLKINVYTLMNNWKLSKDKMACKAYIRKQSALLNIDEFRRPVSYNMVQLTEPGYLRREPNVSRIDFFDGYGIIKDV
jgi:hypothetical protein